MSYTQCDKIIAKDSIQNVQDCNKATKQLAMTTLRKGFILMLCSTLQLVSKARSWGAN